MSELTKRAVIYVFSGTGNTKKVAELYRTNLSSQYDVNIFSVEHLENNSGEEKIIPDPNDYDLCAFAYPVHGFNAPKIFVDFCRSLPSVKNSDSEKKSAFIFKTSGEGLHFNDYSSQKFIKILERKGFTFLSERHYVMPYNMIFRHTPEMVKGEWLYAQKLVKIHAEQILSGKKEKVHTSRLKGWFVPLFRIEWLYAQAQGPFMKVDMNKCVKCMKCVKNCPYDNIRYDEKADRFRFGTKCALCVRCSFNCPSKAISIGLLNGWRVNGSYKIEQTAMDPSLPDSCFGEELKGIKRWLYYKYYRERDNMILEAAQEEKDC